MSSIKCDYCGERGDSLYSSSIVLRTGYDIKGASYRLCAECSAALRKQLDAGKQAHAREVGVDL